MQSAWLRKALPIAHVTTNARNVLLEHEHMCQQDVGTKLGPVSILQVKYHASVRRHVNDSVNAHTGKFEHLL
jgi:hypothetical protein